MKKNINRFIFQNISITTGKFDTRNFKQFALLITGYAGQARKRSHLAFIKLNKVRFF